MIVMALNGVSQGPAPTSMKPEVENNSAPISPEIGGSSSALQRKQHQQKNPHQLRDQPKTFCATAPRSPNPNIRYTPASRIG